MSRTIDERVVEMSFDNQQFEKNANQSISTLDKLKTALNFGGASKGLDEISNSTIGLSGKIESIGSAVNAVANTFTPMGRLAINIFDRISNKVIDMGVNIAKSLSFIEQAQAGWQKYADKTSSVQTIMAATTNEIEDTGERMAYVNEQLDRLNWFTDETSYNFVDMVNNIGKFTANNIKLDDSVTAMQGIATWAAISGGNAQQASRAMYNLSQAMAVGSVKLMDWKSIENANMATAEFKQTVLDTAVAEGKLIKQHDKYYTKTKRTEVSVQSFNQTLSEGWFSSEVLMKTLDKYGGFAVRLGEAVDETGLLTSELIQYIDDYKEGTIDLAAVSKETGMSAEDLSALFEELGSETYDLGRRAFKAAQEAKTFQEAIDSVKDAVSTQWMNTFELVFGDYEHAKVLWTELANELYDIFAGGGELRNELLQQWNEAGGNVSAINAVKNAYGALKGVLSEVSDVFRNIFPRMTSDRLVEITKKVEDFTKKVKDLFVIPEIADDTERMWSMASKAEIDPNNTIGRTKDRLDNIRKATSGVLKVVELVKTVLSDFITKTAVPLLKMIAPLGDVLLKYAGKAGEFITEWVDTTLADGKIGHFFETITNGIKKIVDFFSPVKNTVEVVDKLGETAEKRFAPLSGILDIIGKAWERVKEVFKAAEPYFNKIGDALNGAWDQLHEGIIQGLESGDFSNFMDLFNGGILAVLITKLIGFVNKLKELQNGGAQTSIVDTVKETLSGIKSAVTDFLHIDVDQFKNVATMLGILAASLFVLSLVDQSKLAMATVALSSMLGVLFIFENKMAAITSTKKGSARKSFLHINDSIPSLIAMSIAIFILASSLKKIAKMDPANVAMALISVIALIAALTVAVEHLGKHMKKMKNGTGVLIEMSLAVYVLSVALKNIAKIDKDRVWQSVGAIGALMGMIAVMAAMMSSIKKMPNMSSFIGVAVSVVILVGALKMLSTIDDNKLKIGLMSITGVLLALTGFTYLMSKIKHLDKMAKPILVMSAAVLILSGAFAIFASQTNEGLVTGLIGLGGTIAILAAFMAIMSKFRPQKLESVSTALIKFSAAVVILAIGMKVLGTMSLDSILNALLAVAGAFVVLGISAVMLQGIAPTLMLISGALALFGVALIAVGAGLTVFSIGITTLGTSIAVGGAAIILGITNMVIGILKGIADAIPAIVQIAVNLVVSFCNGITSALPVVANTIVQIILVILETLTLNMGKIVGGAIELAVAFINGVAFGIANNADVIISAFANIVKSIAILIAEALKALLGDIPIIGNDISKAIDSGIEKIKKSMDAKSIGSTAMEEAKEGVIKNQGGLTEAMSFVHSAAYQELLGDPQKFAEVADTQIGAYEDEAKKKSFDLADAFEFLRQRGIETPMSGLGDIGQNGAQNYIDGLLNTFQDPNNIQAIYGSTFNLGTIADSGFNAGTDSHSPSKKAIKSAKNVIDGLILGFESGQRNVENATEDLGNATVNSLQNAISSALSIFDMTVDTEPTIRPVLDLSNIQNGASAINNLLGNSPSLALAGGITMPYIPGRGSNSNTVNVNFSVSTKGELSTDDIQKYGRQIADTVNKELGRRI